MATFDARHGLDKGSTGGSQTRTKKGEQKINLPQFKCLLLFFSPV